MKPCIWCGQPLDVVAKAALSEECSACLWEAGILRDDEHDIPGMIVTDLEAGEGDQAA